MGRCVATLRILARLRHEARMIERACRKQGFHWLVDRAEIATGPAKQRTDPAMPAHAL
jgi:hypothetical protein